MTESILTAVVVTSILLVVYHHVGYPLALRWLGAAYDHSVVSEGAALDKVPTICIVMAAYNEERYIGDKIHNLSALDYPADRLRVLIACDGCTDATARVARRTAADPRCEHLNVEVLEFGGNRGKVAVLNDVMSRVDESIVVMSDISALVSLDALQCAARAFVDPEIGVVSGNYRLLAPGSVGEATYWRYQNVIKAREAALGATLGAPGAFYAIRRELYSPLESDTINDDFVVPMRIVSRGYRAAFLNDVNAVELEGSTQAMDSARRRRIGAGNMQQLIRLAGLLMPRHGGVAFAFASGKALRVLVPYLMVASLVGSVILGFNSPAFAVLALGQVAVYMAVALALWASPPRLPGPFKAVVYLVTGHVSGLIGSLRYLAGLERGRWSRVG